MGTPACTFKQLWDHVAPMGAKSTPLVKVPITHIGQNMEMIRMPKSGQKNLIFRFPFQSHSQMKDQNQDHPWLCVYKKSKNEYATRNLIGHPWASLGGLKSNQLKNHEIYPRFTSENVLKTTKKY